MTDFVFLLSCMLLCSRSWTLIGYGNSSCGYSINGAVKEILKLCPARVLVALYKLPSFDSVDDFLQKVATVRGKLKKGGIVDVESAARIILHDWNEGIHDQGIIIFFRFIREPNKRSSTPS